MRTAGLAVALVAAFGALRYASLREDPPVVDRTAAEWHTREDAITRARVLLAEARGRPPKIVRPHQDPMAFPADRPLRCSYVPKKISGTSPKFDCRLENGEIVKVKYGANPEVPAEIAATRLLAALGFAADHVSHVAELECLGCPPHPFRTRQIAEMFFLVPVLDWTIDMDRRRTFDHVAVERKFEAAPIEAGDVTGWEWEDLDRVDASKGGATRAELDALRLIAVVLGHWDNKASNQRLVCLDRGHTDTARSTTRCQRPVLMLQDLGATFGPSKLDHRSWAGTSIWERGDGKCVATMATLPYGGATFRPVEISEEGRALLLQKLSALSEADLHALFLDAGFPDPVTGERRGDDMSPWVRTFQQKIDDIAKHPACPSAT